MMNYSAGASKGRRGTARRSCFEQRDRASLTSLRETSFAILGGEPRCIASEREAGGFRLGFAAACRLTRWHVECLQVLSSTTWWYSKGACVA